MALPINVEDSCNGYTAKVDKSRSLRVIQSPFPPFGQDYSTRVLRQFFTDDGGPDGDEDMRVSGTLASPVEFFISSRSDKDVFIKSLSFVIADSGADLNEFGGIGALSNGCVLSYIDDEGEVIISDQLVTNWEFVRLCQATPEIGQQTNAFRANNVSGNSEAYTPTLDFQGIFGLPYGIKLRANSSDKISLFVRDDTSGVDQFDIIAYGIEQGEVDEG